MSNFNDLILVIVVGAVPLAFSIWCWLGRSSASRWWVGNPLNERMVLTIIPSWGVAFTPLGLMLLFQGTQFESAIDTVVIVPLILGAVVGFWGFCFVPIPRWWGPAWFRRLTANQRKPKTKRAFDALTVAASRKPQVVSADIGDEIYGGAPRVASWMTSYVYDPDSSERAHGLASKGGVAGRLNAYQEGLVFVATKIEDTLREQSSVVTIGAEQITGFRVVPARAGADGVPRKGRMYRSLFPRLVIDSTGGSFVFEVARAAKVVEQLNHYFGNVQR